MIIDLNINGKVREEHFDIKDAILTQERLHYIS